MFTGNMTAPRVRVSHVGIAVPSIDAALPFYRDVLGLEPGRPETADGATIVGLTLGDVQVELQRATSCTVVVPIELAHAKDGRWLVVGTDLAAVGNPSEPCKR